MFPQESDTVPTVLIGESLLLELIPTDIPLAEMLNKICSALDVQVGNVISVVLSWEENQHSLDELAEQAARFGLYLFSCCAMLSKNQQLLGTLETYSCLLKNPSVDEARVIQRASQLAALAIQRHDRYPKTGAATEIDSAHSWKINHRRNVLRLRHVAPPPTPIRPANAARFEKSGRTERHHNS